MCIEMYAQNGSISKSSHVKNTSNLCKKKFFYGPIIRVYATHTKQARDCNIERISENCVINSLIYF